MNSYTTQHIPLIPDDQLNAKEYDVEWHTSTSSRSFKPPEKTTNPVLSEIIDDMYPEETTNPYVWSHNNNIHIALEDWARP